MKPPQASPRPPAHARWYRWPWSRPRPPTRPPPDPAVAARAVRPCFPATPAGRLVCAPLGQRPGRRRAGSRAPAAPPQWRPALSRGSAPILVRSEARRLRLRTARARPGRTGAARVAFRLLALAESGGIERHRLVGDHAQQVGDAVQARAPLVVGWHLVPRRELGVGRVDHLLVGLGVVPPASIGFQVHRAQLPVLGRILDARQEPSCCSSGLTSKKYLISSSRSGPARARGRGRREKNPRPAPRCKSP